MNCNPIIPIWLMIFWCIGLLTVRLIKRKGILYISRQILLVVLLFVMNLRIMIPVENGIQKGGERNTYVLFVLDDTLSMLAEDGVDHKRRIDDMKMDCEHIIDELYGSKFSVISFHNHSQVLLPFQNNAYYTKTVIQGIEPLSSVWATGSSLSVCLEDMEKSLKVAKEKADGDIVVFFMTDGEQINSDKLESFSKLSQFIDGGAVIGYGTSEGAPMYVYDAYSEEGEYLEMSDYPFEIAKSYLDEENCKKIAKDLGIEYIHRTDGECLDQLIGEIEKSSSIKLEDRMGVGYRETYYIFAIPLLFLLVLDLYDYKKVAKIAVANGR